MASSWILSGSRTPIGRFLGDLAHLPAPQLAGYAIRSAVERARIDEDLIGEVIMGEVLSAGVGQAPARQAARFANLSDSIGCSTVNKVCGSGLYSVMLADRAIRSGDHSLIVSGGMESMSQAPHLLRGGRAGWKYGSQPLLDAIEVDGLRCAHRCELMGVYAENVARSHGIDRTTQDGWAIRSHQKAIEAQQSNSFVDEIVPIPSINESLIRIDAGPRADSTLERLAKLKPAFDSSGSVTAGNSSTLSDGAAAVLVASDSLRQRYSNQPAFRIVGTSVHAAKPEELFLAPVGAIEKLLRTTGRTLEEIDLVELNEAFASQTIACMQMLHLDPDRLNVHGGALALGHPIGCSGTRVLVTLMHAMQKYGKSLGIASLCLGGGEAVAMMIELH